MLAAHEKRLDHEHSAAVRRAACDAGTEMRCHIKRSQRLGKKDLYDKAANALA